MLQQAAVNKQYLKLERKYFLVILYRMGEKSQYTDQYATIIGFD
jgi:hypothetical protein